jgi:tetratricopeptide (TPR) repeat protein
MAGGDLAIRPSSRRNALFIRARVAAAAGELDRAESLCRTAASHSYRAQGGDGLLLWGDVLTQLERVEEGCEAYQLAIERDPQSESARLAAARLEAVTA